MNTIFLSFSIKNSSVTDFFLLLANQLTRDHKVVIIADIISAHNFYISPKIEIIKLPASGAKSIRGIFFVLRLLNSRRPVTTISNFSTVGPFLIAGFLLGIRNRIAWCHSISSQFIGKRPIIDKKRIIYKLATVIYANSKSTKKDLLENFGLKENKVEVVYNAVREYKGGKLPLDKNQIIYVGRMDKTKGVEVLLKAMPTVLAAFPSLKLKLIGDDLKGDNIKKLRSYSEFLEIQNSIEFVGNSSKKLVMEEFSRSYLTVVPSLVEAFGYVIIESFCVRTPVIGSDTSGISEIVRHGEDGYLFEPRNSAELALRIIEVLSDENLRSNFSENCYERFRVKFEINEAISRLSKKINKQTVR